MRLGNLLILVISTMCFLFACSAPKPGTPEAVYMEKQEKAKKEAKQTIDELPDWYLNSPEDGIELYVASTSRSMDLQMAVDKAKQDAKSAMADKLQAEVSGKMKTFMEETGVGDDVELSQEAMRVSSSLFTNVNLAGYRIVEKKIIQQGGGFRAYLLLSYPIAEANRILIDQVSKNAILNSRLRASKAFTELESEIKN